MTHPAYVEAIVKYKSPHAVDLSFAKGEIIRVTGYANRDEGEVDDEDERWYLGHIADDPTRSGQFPANLVTPTTAPSTDNSDGAAADDGTPGHLAVRSTTQANEPEAPSLGGPDPAAAMASTAVMTDSGHQEHAAAESAPMATVERAPPQPEAVRSPTDDGVAPAASTSEVQEGAHELHTADKEVAPPPSDVAERMTDVKNARSATSDSVPSTETSAAKSNEPVKVDEEPEKPATSNEEPVDPSRLSLRDRIAAFNKPAAEKAAPPISRGKSGGWKRPPPAEGEKPLLPTQTSSTGSAPKATAANQASSKSEESPAATDKVDASADAGHGSFSASDAKSSIKMSLKERMAALQRGGEESRSVPSAIPAATPSSDVSAESTVPEQQTQIDEDDNPERRASIARRMAALGGRRMDAGFFAPRPEPTNAPAPAAVPAAAEDSDAAPAQPTADVAKEMTEDVNGQPQPLNVPRRAAPPRTRRSQTEQAAAPNTASEESSSQASKASVSDKPTPLNQTEAPVTSPDATPVPQSESDAVPSTHDAATDQDHDPNASVSEEASARGPQSTNQTDSSTAPDKAPSSLVTSVPPTEAPLDNESKEARAQVTGDSQVDEEPTRISSSEEAPAPGAHNVPKEPTEDTDEPLA